ncbi:MAG: hypothetical protein E7169_01600 [Firmicutes bacterium]|nr:hypothetical protein [Bacillota bacterium]
MKVKIKFENIFVVLSILFIFGCCCFYGTRLVKYYRVFNPKNEAGEKTEVFSSTVRQNNPVVSEGDGLYIHNGDFVFKGEEVNNYVSYIGKTWRIMQVNRTGSVKLVLDESLTEMVYDEEENTYDKSKIYTYIKNKENLKLDTTSLEKMTICLDLIDDSNKITCEKTIEEYVSILSISDYGNSVNTANNKSFLNNSDYIWLYNQNNDGLGWNVTKGFLTQSELDSEYAVKPVIVLKGTAHSEKGDGSKDNPYIVKDGE